MRKQFYLPLKESDVVIWFNIFSEKIKNTYASTFGISNADADKLVEYAAFYAFLVGYLNQLRTFSQGVTKYKNAFKNSALNTPLPSVPQFTITLPAIIPTEAAMMKTIRSMVKRIKAHPKYTTAIGEDLGIEGAAHAFNADEYKPGSKAKSMAGFVEIEFIKRGVEAVNIYGNPVGSDADEWVFLGTQTQSPFRDKRALAVAGKPEHRRFRLRGVMADKEIGQWSDMISVVFGG